MADEPPPGAARGWGEPPSTAGAAGQPAPPTPDTAKPARDIPDTGKETSTALDTGGSAPQAPDPAAATGLDPLDVDALPGGARGALEAVLMVIDEPVSEVALASALTLPVETVVALLEDLEREYAAACRGFTLRAVGGGWRVYSRAEYAPVVERFLTDGQSTRLSQAALETLAVIAYRQPVSRGRVAAVRGVSVDGVVRTLLSRGLVEEQGAGEGGAVLYGTTPAFLARLGLRSLDELPPLSPYLPDVDLLEDIAADGRG